MPIIVDSQKQLTDESLNSSKFVLFVEQKIEEVLMQND